MALPEYFEFQIRTKTIFGAGTLSEVSKEAARLGGTKVFIVTGSTAKKLGMLKRIEESLETEGIKVVGTLEGIPPNSDVETVEKGYQSAKSSGTDLLLTIGGGSIIDTAKGMNILLTEGGNLLEDHQGTYLLERPLKPLIAIPTTAGSGSEATFASVIRDNQQKLKISFISPYIAPDVAILDPELTLSMPAKLTASTGMDALCHAIESIHSLQNEPVADGLALHAIRLISQNLKEATKNGKNLEARSNMLIASNMAGLAFSNALVGAVHAMAHACGGLCEVPHGIANAVLLPYGMEYNLDYCPDRYALAAKAWGLETKGLSDKEATKAVIEAIKSLTKELGLPQKLSEVGVKEEDIGKLAEDAISDGSIYNNPREATEEEIAEVLKKAL